MVTAARKRLFLRYLFFNAQNSGKSLFTVLSELMNAYVGQVVGTASGARQPITHSGNGRTVTFAIPDHFKFETSEERGDLIELLFEVYSDALTTLGFTQKPDWDPEQDTAIFNTMMDDDRVQTIKSTHTDHTLGRLLYGGTISFGS